MKFKQMELKICTFGTMRKLLFILLSCISLSVYSQQVVGTDSTRRLIQFSGLLLDADSLYPIPYAAVVIRHTTRGAYSSPNGYYSLVVQNRDTVDFYALGYKRAYFVIPDTITTSMYNHVQSVKLDTILLREMVVYPWPSKEQFKNAFLSMDIPSDDMERARKNLAQAEMVQLVQQVAMDGKMAYSARMTQYTAKNYYAGQYVPNNLMNPVAWSKFIQGLQNGDFKRQ
ncbi:MAG: hypothetical protein Fur0041_21700 [Bacteroidia bacterium]